jgi:hypothetical protein
MLEDFEDTLNQPPISLTSSDGQVFTINRKAAQQSGFLNGVPALGNLFFPPFFASLLKLNLHAQMKSQLVVLKEMC